MEDANISAENWWLWLRNRGYGGSAPFITLEIHRVNALPGCEFERKFGTRVRCFHMWEQGTSTKYFHNDDIDAFEGSFISQLQENHAMLEEMEAETVRRSERLITSSSKLYELDLSEMDPKSLNELFSEVTDLYWELGVYSSIPLFGGRVLEERMTPALLTMLEGKGELERFGECFSGLTAFSYLSPQEVEREALFGIAEAIRSNGKYESLFREAPETILEKLPKYPELEEMIESHRMEYEHVPYKWIGPVWKLPDFVKRLAKIIKGGEEYVPMTDEETIEARRAQLKEDMGIDEEYGLYFDALQTLAKMKEIKAAGMSKGAYHLERFRKEVMRRYGILKRQSEMMISLDYKRLLETGKIDLDEINQRINMFLWSTMGGETFASGDEAARIVAPLLERLRGDYRKQNEFYGMPASPGEAVGRITMVLDFDSDSGDFKRGDILGAYRTTPHYEVLMMDAEGIAIQEAGQSQHGAVYSRRMGKPALIGVQGLEFAFETGEPVHLNANRGVLRRLSEEEYSKLRGEMVTERPEIRRVRRKSRPDIRGPFIVPLSQAAEYKRDLVGNKGLNQGIIFPFYYVPHGYIATSAFHNMVIQETGFEKHLDRLAKELAEPTDKNKADELSREYVQRVMEFPLELFAPLVEPFEALREDSLKIVRSSSLEEDRRSDEKISFAGTLESIPGIKERGELLTSAKRVIASLYYTTPMVIMSRFGIDPRDHYMAILVQEMVNSIASGTIFTNCNHGKHMVVEYVHGQLGPYMSHEFTPERYLLDKKTGRLLDYLPGNQKRVQVIKNGDLVYEGVDKIGVIPEKDMFELWMVGLDIERCFNDYDQDIEFAYAMQPDSAETDRPLLYILQNRDQLDPIIWAI